MEHRHCSEKPQRRLVISKTTVDDNMPFLLTYQPRALPDIVKVAKPRGVSWENEKPLYCQSSHSSCSSLNDTFGALRLQHRRAVLKAGPNVPRLQPVVLPRQICCHAAASRLVVNCTRHVKTLQTWSLVYARADVGSSTSGKGVLPISDLGLHPSRRVRMPLLFQGTQTGRDLVRWTISKWPQDSHAVHC